jgi:hypothetical protein
MVSNNSINNTVQNNDFSVNRSLAGTAVFSSSVHSDNTNAASNAKFQATVGGANGGDAYTNYLVTGAGTWSIGIDNTSTTDLLKFTTGATPSAGTEFIKMGNSGIKDWIGFLDAVAPANIGFSTFRITDETIGGNVGLLLNNTDNTNASSDAVISVDVGGANAGDPCIAFSTTVAGETVIFGMDNSDSNKLKITQGGDRPSNGNIQWVMTTAGERTMPLQPAFGAYLAATTANNKIGFNATYQLGTDALTEIFDQNADFNVNGTFTAPVTGLYHLNSHWFSNNVTQSQFFTTQIVTSNRTYQVQTWRAAGAGNSGNTITDLCDMDAGDTAVIKVLCSGEAANTVGIFGDAVIYTGFNGYLEC